MKPFIGTKVIDAAPAVRNEEPGFRVRYPDGYESWSPARPFLEAYRAMDEMTFGDAIHMLKSGRLVRRAGWNGKGMWLCLQRPDNNSKMTLPYIYMRTVQGDMVPWLASQTDMLADDWQLVDLISEAGA